MKGGIDKFSDIDLSIVVESEKSLQDVKKQFSEFVSDQGDILAHFSADHLQFHSTQIIYLGIDNWVVKLDVTIASNKDQLTLPPEAKAIVDRDGVLTNIRRNSTFTIDAFAFFEKLCGWLWYTYSRLERGEILAAARSIDFSREAALLPLILARLRLPQDGHRRLEQRLPIPLLALIQGTYPKALEREAILSALAQLHKLTLLELELSAVERKNELRVAMSKMWERIIAASQYRDDDPAGL